MREREREKERESFSAPTEMDGERERDRERRWRKRETEREHIYIHRYICLMFIFMYVCMHVCVGMHFASLNECIYTVCIYLCIVCIVHISSTTNIYMAPSIISHNKFTVDIGNVKRSARLGGSCRSLSRRSALDWIFYEWHFRKALI